jgi:hypothetical protein
MAPGEPVSTHPHVNDPGHFAPGRPLCRADAAVFPRDSSPRMAGKTLASIRMDESRGELVDRFDA